MNFDLSEEQKMIVDTVASFVKKQSPVSRARMLREDELGWDKKVWRQMGEFGWLGIALPDHVGGNGGSFLDAALILEQLGGTLVPEPVLPALVAADAVMTAGNAEQQRRWVAPMAEGKTLLALAALEASSRADVRVVGTRAEKSGAGYRLSGEKRWVSSGHAADVLIVSALAPGGLSLFAVDRDSAGVTVTPVKTMDGRHAAMVRFDNVEVGADQLLGAEGSAGAALEHAFDLGAAGACAEGYGIMRSSLWMTVEYLRTREQFGVKIGTFQALQHRAVDMFVETELCKSTMILAALELDNANGAVRRSAISAAKVQLAVGGKFVTQQAIQLHGGIGVTDEHDIGLYFKRMHVLNTLYGDEEHHLARFTGEPTFLEGAQGE